MRRYIWLSAFFALAISAQGCTYEYCPGTADADAYIEPPHVVAQSAPPAPPVQVEVRPAQPSAQSVWVSGHYSWEGGRWVWIPGLWSTPRAGYVWQEPVAVQAQGGVRYHPGYWRPSQAEPPPVYRQPSAVAVTVHADANVNGGNVVHAQPTNNGGVTTVVAQPAQAQGIVTTVVTQQPARNGGVTTVIAQQPTQAHGNVQVTAPQAHGGVTTVVTQPARPNGAGTVVTTVQPQPANGGVTAVATRPNGVGVVNTVPQQNGGVVAVRPAQGAGTVTTAPARPNGVAVGTVVGPQQQGGQANVQAGVRPATVGGIGQRQPGVGVATVQTQGQLRCSLGATFAPRGGAVVVNGSGLNGAVIMIGGTTAPTMNGNASQITVQVPANSRGGSVTASAGGQQASCGNLRITGQM